MPRAELRGQQLYYERSGVGEPLLLIPGLSANHEHWGEPYMRALHARGFETVAYDHRGIGLSRHAPASFGIPDLADDAAALLDALGLERTHVMGASMGGMVAQELALRHPGKVDTLVLGCTFAGGPQSTGADPALIERLATLLTTGRIAEAMRLLFEINVSTPYAADPAHWEEFKAMGTRHPASLDVLLGQLQATGRHDASGRLGDLKAPTLIVHGTEDQLLPVANASHLMSLIPHARAEILEGVGHCFWWERPERSAELVGEHAVAATCAAGTQGPQGQGRGASS